MYGKLAEDASYDTLKDLLTGMNKSLHCPVGEEDKREATTSVIDSGVREEVAELKKQKRSKAWWRDLVPYCNQHKFHKFLVFQSCVRINHMK